MCLFTLQFLEKKTNFCWCILTSPLGVFNWSQIERIRSFLYTICKCTEEFVCPVRIRKNSHYICDKNYNNKMYWPMYFLWRPFFSLPALFTTTKCIDQCISYGEPFFLYLLPLQQQNTLYSAFERNTIRVFYSTIRVFYRTIRRICKIW